MHKEMSYCACVHVCVWCGLPVHLFFVPTGLKFHKFSECENVRVETLRSASAARKPKCVSSPPPPINLYARTDHEQNRICFYGPHPLLSCLISQACSLNIPHSNRATSADVRLPECWHAHCNLEQCLPALCT